MLDHFRVPGREQAGDDTSVETRRGLTIFETVATSGRLFGEFFPRISIDGQRSPWVDCREPSGWPKVF